MTQRTLTRMHGLMSVLVVILCMVSCTQASKQSMTDGLVLPNEDDSGLYSCKIVFEGGIEQYAEFNPESLSHSDTRAAVNSGESVIDADGNLMATLIDDTEYRSFNRTQTRAAAEWSDGATVYLLFQTGGNKVQGRAVYSSSTSEWTLYYYNPIANTEGATYLAYYFEGTVEPDHTNLRMLLEPTTAVYGTTTALYVKNGHDITVQAILKPIYGRVKFKGESGYSFKVAGLNYCNYLTFSDASLNTCGLDSLITIGADGYSPFYYGGFMFENQEMVVSTDRTRYLTDYATGIMAAGKSGIIETPCQSKSNGWIRRDYNEKDLLFNLNGTSFAMKYVEAGSFQRSFVANEMDIVQTVTLTKDYYMAETEVTNGLWYSVCGGNWNDLKTSWNARNHITWSAIQDDFIPALNSLSGLSFRMSTEAEWEYAARGGKYEHGYTYSGSNNINDVAWYKSNQGSNSGHRVALLAPNELGLYDMSGNLREWCSDFYADYTPFNLTNPTGPATGSDRVSRGGSWDGDAGDCGVLFRNSNSPSYRSSYLGMRLCLSL